VEGNAKGDATLVFGRVTYEMMVSYWPTPQAKQDNPVVADRMNSASKLVISRTLQQSPWNNTMILNGDLAMDIRALKQKSGPPLVILGSGSIIAQLSQARLIDEYQLVVIPIALGHGRTIFEGITDRLPLTLTSTRTFKNGNLFSTYTPAV